mgnify:FL=1
MSSSSSSSSSTSSASLETSSLLRLNGSDLFSGLDTDSIIKKLTSGTRSKITAQKQLEQKTEWKRDEYRSIESILEDFKSTYLSYTSDTNFLSSSFFENTSITSSSAAVTATGSADDAANVTINSISQLAKEASFSSTHQVSDKTITSETMYDSWTASDAGGKSLIVNYKGTDYTLTMSYSVQLDSENSTVSGDEKTVDSSEIQKVVDGLNNQIEDNSSIKDKISFSYDEDTNKISLKAADDSQVILKPYAASKYDTSGTEFLKSLGFSGSNQSGTSITGGEVDKNVNTSGLFNKTVSSSSYIKVNYNNQDYTVKLGADIDIYAAKGDSKIIGNAIAKQINSQISSDSSLTGLSGVTAFADSDGAITFSSGATVTGGSTNMVNGLYSYDSTNETYTAKAADSKELTKSYIGDTLEGSTVTFNLNGVKKTITFDATDKSDYDTADEIKGYLKDKLDNAFGEDTVTVGYDTTSKKLTLETADGNSVLTLSSSSDSINVLNKAGALRMSVGESNRAETSKTLEELNGELSAGLKDSDGKFYDEYTISVNGKELSFTKDQTLGDVISEINDAGDAGVTVSYSQTLNTFRVIADDTGSQGKVEIKDVSGNLAESLFGTSGTDYTATSGQDLKMNVTLNGSTTDITRSTNNFTLDGLTLQVGDTYNYDSTNNTIADSSQKITFTSDNNTDDLYTNIVSLVNDYNKIIKEVYTQVSESPERNSSNKVKYQPLTDDEKESMSDDEITAWNTKAKKGLLQNDSALNSLLTDFNAAVEQAVSSAGMSLSQLGISTASTDVGSGPQLSVDTSTLKSVLASSSEKVKEMFTNSDGISQRLQSVLTKYTSTSTATGDGVLILLAGKESFSNDTSELTTQIKAYESTIDDLNDRLETEEDRYWTQFTNMEVALSTLTAQSEYLSSMFSSGS